MSSAFISLVKRISSQRLCLLLALGAAATMVACGIQDTSDQSMEADEPWNWSEEFVRSAVDQVRAGRDLNPDSWPGGAKVAVLLSYDVDLSLIHI